MSALTDKRAICREIATSDLGLTHLEIDNVHYIVGPFGTLIPLCAIYFRKVGDEYRIDYDQFLLVWRDDEVTLPALERRVRDGGSLWVHNVYPMGFTLASITEGKRSQTVLIDRIRAFLLENAKSGADALEFARTGDTKFLQDCRRLKPSDYETRLLAKLI